MAGVIFDGKTVAPAILVEKEVPSTEWQPNPLWPDIEKLVEEDTSTYTIKAGVVLYGAGDVTTFDWYDDALGVWNKIITSDGAEYNLEYPNTSVTHTWDTTKDIDDGTGLPVRYLILLASPTVSSTQQGIFPGAIDGQLYPAYIYIKGSYEKSSITAFGNNPLLQYVKVNGTVTLLSNYDAFKNDVSLVKMPENIVFNPTVGLGAPFSNCPRITDMSSLVLQSDFPSIGYNSWNWPSVSVMPDNVLATKPTTLEDVGYDSADFMSLIKIPDGWDLSQCTNFFGTFVSVPNLAYAGTVDMSANATSFRSTRSAFNLPNLRDIKCTLPSNTNVWFDSSTTISIESFRFMANHAPDVTATPRTLTVGSTNISRINEADPTIITDLNAKGWTVA